MATPDATAVGAIVRSPDASVVMFANPETVFVELKYAIWYCEPVPPPPLAAAHVGSPPDSVNTYPLVVAANFESAFVAEA